MSAGREVLQDAVGLHKEVVEVAKGCENESGLFAEHFVCVKRHHTQVAASTFYIYLP